MWKRWEHMEDHICPFIMESSKACPAWDVDAKYMDWFLQITHPYVNPIAKVQIVDLGRADKEFQHILHLLADEDILVADPLPRASQRPQPDEPSMWERGESSRMDEGWAREEDNPNDVDLDDVDFI
ncbi:hypothetical protein V2J09_000005 [Rumex salicifolius]